jgi:hypothetical protein
MGRLFRLFNSKRKSRHSWKRNSGYFGKILKQKKVILQQSLILEPLQNKYMRVKLLLVSSSVGVSVQ